MIGEMANVMTKFWLTDEQKREELVKIIDKLIKDKNT